MISRETRRLLITVLVAVTALWVLARIRFQERPASSTPVPNVLAQLRPSPTYADLARTIADIRPLITAAVSASASGAPVLRISDTAAVTLLPGGADTPVAVDRATGLAIVTHAHGDMPGLMPWVPRLLDYPRYLVAADVTRNHIALRPVFIGGLFPASSDLWSGEIWLLPSAAAITPGTFVFTTEGAFAGIGVSHEGHGALVPATVLNMWVERLKQPRTAGDLGVSVQHLSSSLASATGASSGVVVTSIDPNGPAVGALVATDVIEAIDGTDLHTLDHWRARALRASAGDTLTLRVRSNEGVREVAVTAIAAGPATEPANDATLGLRLRAIPKTGVEVLAVQPRSRGARAGIQQGDVIIVAGGTQAPSPAQFAQLFRSLPQGRSLVIALARGDEHRVVAIDK